MPRRPANPLRPRPPLPPPRLRPHKPACTICFFVHLLELRFVYQNKKKPRPRKTHPAIQQTTPIFEPRKCGTQHHWNYVKYLIWFDFFWFSTCLNEKKKISFILVTFLVLHLKAFLAIFRFFSKLCLNFDFKRENY